MYILKEYIGKRALTGILTIFIAVFLNFMLIKLAPGDPISILAGPDQTLSEELVAELQEKYGLNDPVLTQFVTYLKTVAQGDLGHSILNNEPVFDIIVDRLGPTFLLTLTAVFMALVIGTVLGIYCARNLGSKLDTFISQISYVFDSMPPFWLGMMFILIFASTLSIFPSSGMEDLRAGYTGIAHYLDILHHLALPLITLTLVSTPYFFRISRASVIHVMSEDFVTTFRAAGMSEKRIFNKYIFKNAILPTITLVGISLAFTITGVAIIEIVFAWPGMGSLMLDAIMRRDYPLLMGIYLVLSISIAVVMLIVDVIYAVIDPRIRYKN